jgi:predicted methyltransferase
MAQQNHAHSVCLILGAQRKSRLSQATLKNGMDSLFQQADKMRPSSVTQKGTHMRIAKFIGLACLGLGLASPVFAMDAALAKAIAGSHRTPEWVARDSARHPQEELEFFGIKPTMTVVEIVPGGGYWTEILAPYLKDKGAYYSTVSPRSLGERAVKAADAWQAKFDANKDVYGKAKVVEFGRGTTDIVPEGTADMVLTFRNVHNWMMGGMQDEAFAAFFKALKPGGILGVEEHRGRTDQPQDPKAASGYVRQDYAIALAEKAGFKLVGKSEILANPKDTKDYPGGVWTLPPTLRLGDQDKEKYLAIGEADNFVLKFEKPKK